MDSSYGEQLLGDSNFPLGTGYFEKGTNQVHTYTLKIFFDDNNQNQNEFQELNFAAHLVIESADSSGNVVASGTNASIIAVDNGSGINESKQITVKNNKEVEQDYQVVLQVLGFLPTTDDPVSLNYTLTGENVGKDGQIIQNITNGEIPPSESIQNIVLGTGSLATRNSNHSYTINLSAEKAMFFARLIVNQINLPNYFKEASGNTLLAAIKKNHPNPVSPITKPMEQPSTESIISSTEDDYGTSLYFRGDINDNYVSFAGMCWRIVRTTGNGAIKLALYNYSSSDCTQIGDTLAFARYSGDTYTTKFNANDNDNAYLGFMYGTPGSSTYAQTHANLNKSTILTNLETWYKNKLASYTDKLEDVIWCNDKSTKESKDKYNFAGGGYGTNNTLYGAGYRFENCKPSLICPKDDEGGNLSKFTVSDTSNGNGKLTYPIGLLTVDELAFSGFHYQTGLILLATTQNNSYLNYNALNPYWLLSPMIYHSSSDQGAINNSWRLHHSNTNQTLAIRPVIALKSSTVVASGNGTATNPYVIN